MKEKIDIDHLASLSALEFTPEQKEQYAKEFEGIMELVEKISNFDLTEQIAYEPIPVSDLREDEVKPGLTQDEVLTNAPNKKQGCFAVPLMME